MTDGDSRPSRNTARLNIEVVHAPQLRATGLAAWLRRVVPARARGAVTVALVPDTRIRALNRKFRRNDAPTDVLSFPADGSGGTDGHGYLGDVVIATGVAQRQARDAGHSVQTELRVLALHGLLPLLGYDHETDDGRMARLERRLRRQGGLHEGLIERNGNVGRLKPAPARASRGRTTHSVAGAGVSRPVPARRRG